MDSVDVQFQERFNQPDLSVLQKLEEILLTGGVDGIIDHYPELTERLKVQLVMFRSKYTFKTRTEVATIMREMPVEIRGLFETLVWLLYVIPVLSAEAGRCFSALRRLKTWLRSTMTKMRLNNAAVCLILFSFLCHGCMLNCLFNLSLKSSG